MEFEELLPLAKEKIALGYELLRTLECLMHVDGVKKIQRKIGQEIKFIEKVVKNKTIQKNHVLCSNLIHFKSLVSALQKFHGLQHVDYAVPVSTSDKTTRVDIVAENGAVWIKVIARNPKSIKATVDGMASFGAKSVLDQAEEIIQLSQLNLHLYQPPKVIFLFVNQIDSDLQNSLEEIGVEVQYFTCQDDNENSSDEKCGGKINVLNLDVTTLIAYVSSLTNGNAFNCDFGKDSILSQQAKMEQKSPVKPILDELFQGKKLICCETAVKAFQGIVELLAGPGEVQRAKEFIERLQILPDVGEENYIEGVGVSGQVKERSLKIFSFGNYHKAINVTSNEGFYRSMKNQGINLPVYLHQARALTELKEKTVI